MKTRKELKEQYKQRKNKMGVFQIKNTHNNKIFIGSNLDLNAIWNRQKMQLKLESHPNKDHQEDWKEYGEESFIYEILAELKQDDKKEINYKRELKELEKLYIEELEPFEAKGYNKKLIKN